MAVSLVWMMLFGFLIGIPVAFAILMPVTWYLVVQQVPLFVIPQKLANGVESFPLLAVPFFIAAGELMNTGGVTKRLVNLAGTMVGHITGGLGHVVVVTNMIMAGMSGSALADAAGTGRVLVPAMVQKGFKPAFAAALVASAGIIGPIIPPSISFVLYGFVASTSVGRLFLGGFIPGVMMGLFLMVVVYVISRRRQYPREKRATFGQFLAALRPSVWALFMPMLIIGGILSGTFTPTEAAGIAAIYGLIVGLFVYREIKLADLYPIAVRVVRSSAVVLIIVAAASVLQFIFARENVGVLLIQLFAPIADNRALVLIAVNLLVLLLGCFFEGNLILLLFTPLFLPLIDSLGIDRVHFGVFYTVNLMIGAVTPPVGTVMYVVLNVSGVKMKDFVREVWPMLLSLILLLFIITFNEDLVLFVPNLLMGAAK